MEEEADSMGASTATTAAPAPSEAQLKWLARGVEQPGGKLPLFDRDGQRVSTRTVESCIRHGWAAPWFNNPLKPDWMVCKLTDAGRALVEAQAAAGDAEDEANVVPLRR